MTRTPEHTHRHTARLRSSSTLTSERCRNCSLPRIRMIRRNILIVPFPLLFVILLQCRLGVIFGWTLTSTSTIPGQYQRSRSRSRLRLRLRTRSQWTTDYCFRDAHYARRESSARYRSQLALGADDNDNESPSDDNNDNGQSQEELEQQQQRLSSKFSSSSSSSSRNRAISALSQQQQQQQQQQQPLPDTSLPDKVTGDSSDNSSSSRRNVNSSKVNINSKSNSNSILPRTRGPSGSNSGGGRDRDRDQTTKRRSRIIKSNRKSQGSSKDSDGSKDSSNSSSNTGTSYSAQELAASASASGAATTSAKSSSSPLLSKLSKSKQSRTRTRPTGGAFGTSFSSSSDSSSDSATGTTKPKQSYSSLLPPPLTSGETSSENEDEDEDDPLSTGLSSWEEFLGASSAASSSSSSSSAVSSSSSAAVSSPPLPSTENTRFGSGSSSSSSQRAGPGQGGPGRRSTAPKATNTNATISQQQRLPSVQDLFPPDAATSSPADAASSSTSSSSTSGSTGSTISTGNPNPDKPPNQEPKQRGRRSQPVLDGVLPVSDLFYRSSQQQQQDADDADNEGDEEDHDDEELPFSAEQSDAVSSDNNKVHIRRNMAQQQQDRDGNGRRDATDESTFGASSGATAASGSSTSSTNTNTKKKSGRKMVRRGMEMLVGGVPINADPPQRAVELYYDDMTPDWGSTISLSTRDFGPLLHTASTAKVSTMEKGLFCEHFCHAAMKWDVCPKDLRQIVKSFSMQQFQSQTEYASSGNRPVRLKDVATENASTTGVKEESRVSGSGNGGSDGDSSRMVETTDTSAIFLSNDNETKDETTNTNGEESEESSLSSDDEDAALGTTNADDDSTEADATVESALDSSNKDRSKAKGFGKGKGSKHPKRNRKLNEPELAVEFGVSLEIGVSKEELESGNGGADGGILKSIFNTAVASALKHELTGFQVTALKLKLIDLDDGTTLIDAQFTLRAIADLSHSEIAHRMKDIDAAFPRTIDDGELQVAMAAAAKDDTQWPEEIRARVIEELLFGDDEEGISPAIEIARSEHNARDSCEVDSNGASPLHLRDDIFHGGGRDGVFYDYSEKNALDSPYRGEIGLRLVDAVTERAKQRSPRVIAIGDVHGCIDELQDLLRECNYQPGDLVVFLGDLVCKGPDSTSVVQMAREIGAIGVRGNHDFEVIRWHQAIKSGVDPPVVGSEHFHIASCLSKADMNWMYSLPWYISSKELGALFVHAGFVSGIRLAKQNPRLMMNMRSILPDGTVTSKFFNNWPWARLWDGPQTVLFGHDADRGLQQYEHAIGLDTGCVYGGRLTACILPEKRLVSVSARREYFKYRRKHYD